MKNKNKLNKIKQKVGYGLVQRSTFKFYLLYLLFFLNKIRIFFEGSK